MGKLKIAKTEETTTESAQAATLSSSPVKVPKKKITSATLHIEATFNNTKVVLSDKGGNTLFWSSAGSLGFKGAKKGTPFAASKVGDVLGEKAAALGIKDIDVVVTGVGSGREPTIRAFLSRGFELTGVRDTTPVPHNGPKPKKPRRV
ncbi:MAG: 30S ribosomal protein S11 [Candidatus Pacebacteria bacterium]|jgi:small subunit ribosomal protein S11|nr:30S ribosomal protein S11 [Candidatus Paceibacterota bacterium]